jgi:hypothetical protein
MPSTALPSIYDVVAATGAWKPPLYLQAYEQFFEPIRHLPLALLELGIYQGGSMKAWEAYFSAARIAGIDRTLPPISLGDRIRMFAGDQTDCRFLTRVAAEMAPGGLFDLIIDDCSHIGELSKITFWHLFDSHLKPGGFYCIEDWGTGFLEQWPDGRALDTEPDTDRHMPSHDAGMVGFVKQLVDELHAHIFTPEQRISKFASMTLHTGVCIITKAGEPNWPAMLGEAPAASRPLSWLVRHLAGRRGRGGKRARR